MSTSLLIMTIFMSWAHADLTVTQTPVFESSYYNHHNRYYLAESGTVELDLGRSDTSRVYDFNHPDKYRLMPGVQTFDSPILERAGEFVFIGSRSGSRCDIMAYTITDGEPAEVFRQPLPYSGYSSYISGLSLDHQKMYVASDREKNTILVYDIVNHVMLPPLVMEQLVGDDDTIGDIFEMPYKGETVLAVSASQAHNAHIFFYSLDGKTLKGTLTSEQLGVPRTGYSSRPTYVWSPDRSKIVLCSDKTCASFDVASARMLASLATTSGDAVEATWTADSRYVIMTAGYNNLSHTFSIIDAMTGLYAMPESNLPGTVNSVMYIPQLKRHLVFIDNATLVLGENGALLQNYVLGAGGVTLNIQSARVMSADAGAAHLRMIDSNGFVRDWTLTP